MTTLITGASGFIGRHLIAHLAESDPGEPLATLGLTAPDGPALRHITCDMRDQEKVAEAIASIAPQKIYHLVGSARVNQSMGMPEYFASNYLTTISLLRALEKRAKPVRIFFSSSVHVYGNQAGTVCESTPAHPAGAYAFTKYLAEEALRDATKRLEFLSVVIGRLYTCIGPGQGEGFVAADLCRKIAELPPAGGVLTTRALSGFRCFLDVRDAVRIFPVLLAAPHPTRFDIFNIASPQSLSISDMVSLLVKLSGKSPRIESHPDAANPFHGLVLESEKLQRVLPAHAFRPIETTLRDMLAWAASRR